MRESIFDALPRETLAEEQRRMMVELGARARSAIFYGDLRAAATNFAGIAVVASCALPFGERFYPDWQDRLERNLSRPTTGRWEPLTRRFPDLYVVDRTKPWPGIVGSITNLEP